MSPESDFDQLRLDKSGLYREETITDGRAGTIRRMIPVRPDGSDDTARAVLFQGQTQIATPAGVLPINFGIDADTLEQAIDNFAAAAQTGIEETMREIEQMRKDAASSLYVPQAGGRGAPGGGGIQIP